MIIVIDFAVKNVNNVVVFAVINVIIVTVCRVYAEEGPVGLPALVEKETVEPRYVL